VASVGHGLVVERMRICSELWAVGIKAEYGYKANPNPKKQTQYASEQGMKYMVFIGETEMKNNNVQVKNMVKKTEKLVPREELATFLKKNLAIQRRRLRREKRRSAQGCLLCAAENE